MRFVIHLNVTNQVITSTIFCFLYQSILHCWQLLCNSNSIYDVGNHVTTQHIQWTDSSTGSRLWVSWQLYMIMSITRILSFIIINSQWASFHFFLFLFITDLPHWYHESDRQVSAWGKKGLTKITMSTSQGFNLIFARKVVAIHQNKNPHHPHLGCGCV